MKFAIICSVLDPAGLTIKENLLEQAHWEESGVFDTHPVYSHKNLRLYTITTRLIRTEDLDTKIDADVFLFASKHVSKEAVPSLTCHVIGNWDAADYGGRARTLVSAPAALMRACYLEMMKFADQLPHHEITLEATHHGPYQEKPALFIEIGSNEEQWKDQKSGEILAKVILSITSKTFVSTEIGFGIGGLHYCNNFLKVLERTDIALGHICPKYMLESLDEDMIRQAMEKSGASFVLLDWKGLGKEKERIVSLLEKMDVEMRRVEKVLKG